MAADHLKALSKGSRVWYIETGDWQLGSFSGLSDSGTVLVTTADGQQLQISAQKVHPANPDMLDGIPDLTELTQLNEPSLLHNLRHRFSNDAIYTFAGPVLVAVNPCRIIDALYTTAQKHLYERGAKETVNNLAPHIYLIAAQAYRCMERENQSQSIVITGESGAGKTETTKKAMQFFAALAGGTGIEEQVLESNPILEAFGNAKTSRNPNSSRFGKLIQIHFNHTHHICGASIRTYLLEKSRVVRPLEGERSYHVFYQLIKGADASLRSSLHLSDNPLDYNYLAQTGCVEVEGVDDAAEYLGLMKALGLIGLNEEERHTLMRIVAGVLLLGNITITTKKDSEEAEVVPGPALDNCCDVLGVPADLLSRCLTSEAMKVRGESLSKKLKKEEALAARDALAKAIYARMFDWIVDRINRKLTAGKKTSGLFIAILDIFGFELFNRNSFEQLCINYANEVLQCLFNKHLFKLQQQEYREEGLPWENVEYHDNQAIVDLIDPPPGSNQGAGILTYLNDTCKVPKGDDPSFNQRLKTAFAKHPRFRVNPLDPGDFLVEHFAGLVQYSSEGFVEKNRDQLKAGLVEIMSASSVVPLAEFGKTITKHMEQDRRGSSLTVGTRFSRDMRELVSALEACGLHFVRCIKPNKILKPNTVENDMVLHQMKCAGVLEVVRIAKAGYPSKIPLVKFVERYNVPLPGLDHRHWMPLGKKELSNTKLACDVLLKRFNIQDHGFLVGNSKIFFRAGALGRVEDHWAKLMRLATVLQAASRQWHLHTWFKRHRKAAVVLQASIRARKARLALMELVLRKKMEEEEKKRIQEEEKRKLEEKEKKIARAPVPPSTPAAVPKSVPPSTPVAAPKSAASKVPAPSSSPAASPQTLPQDMGSKLVLPPDIHLSPEQIWEVARLYQAGHLSFVSPKGTMDPQDSHQNWMQQYSLCSGDKLADKDALQLVMELGNEFENSSKGMMSELESIQDSLLAKDPNRFSLVRGPSLQRTLALMTTPQDAFGRDVVNLEERYRSWKAQFKADLDSMHNILRLRMLRNRSAAREAWPALCVLRELQRGFEAWKWQFRDQLDFLRPLDEGEVRAWMMGEGLVNGHIKGPQENTSVPKWRWFSRRKSPERTANGSGPYPPVPQLNGNTSPLHHQVVENDSRPSTSSAPPPPLGAIDEVQPASDNGEATPPRRGWFGVRAAAA